MATGVAQETPPRGSVHHRIDPIGFRRHFIGSRLCIQLGIHLGASCRRGRRRVAVAALLVLCGASVLAPAAASGVATRRVRAGTWVAETPREVEESYRATRVLHDEASRRLDTDMDVARTLRWLAEASAAAKAAPPPAAEAPAAEARSPEPPAPKPLPKPRAAEQPVEQMHAEEQKAPELAEQPPRPQAAAEPAAVSPASPASPAASAASAVAAAPAEPPKASPEPEGPVETPLYQGAIAAAAAAGIPPSALDDIVEATGDMLPKEVVAVARQAASQARAQMQRYKQAQLAAAPQRMVLAQHEKSPAKPVAASEVVTGTPVLPRVSLVMSK
eukprot:TRINITY_DN14897_c0_g2_i1.p1 TRINITY_DN14897_c0_g2~~TRINITY_DN14897_c0_g2_i1.p1  ORF type:complete len:331 (+),score=75.19 TRINITY_DN14897_c0_g2_i1:41-1033(+)